jgi:RNA polymerase sigma factor (sigma-70 family)
MPYDLTGLSTVELVNLVASSRDEHEFAQAVGEIVMRYGNLVYAQALAICSGDHALAEDAFQETFLRLFIWLKGRRGRPPIQSIARLIKVFSRRAAIDLIRKQRPSNPLPEGDLAPAVADEAIKRIEDSLYIRELLDLALLDDRSRDILRLFYLEGLPDQEIARRLDITPNHSRVLRHRAMEKIREYQRLDDLADLIDPV